MIYFSDKPERESNPFQQVRECDKLSHPIHSPARSDQFSFITYFLHAKIKVYYLWLQETALSLNLDPEAITIKCPHCSNKFEETISRLKYEPKLSCPRCKRYVGVNLLELHAMLESVRRHSNNLLKRLTNRSSGKRSA
jgi:hypothetical protein